MKTKSLFAGGDVKGDTLTEFVEGGHLTRHVVCVCNIVDINDHSFVPVREDNYKQWIAKVSIEDCLEILFQCYYASLALLVTHFVIIILSRDI